MSPGRRRVLMLAASAWPGLSGATDAAHEDSVRPGRLLQFPRDHGAHPGAGIEWWYATGWLDRANAAPIGFQITFFRQRTGLAADLPGRFAPRQLLFAHAAISDVDAGRHRHAQRMVRWSADERAADARALMRDTDVSIGHWRLMRDSTSTYRATMAADEAGLQLDLTLRPTQPLLLQGQAGTSQKGPSIAQMSHYYSQPHLAVQARLVLDGKASQHTGTAWLDHEWSDSLMPDGAVGWDWIGMNLRDGAALTAFRLRGPSGGTVWSGGSYRARGGGEVQSFAAADMRFTPLRTWLSPTTGARYPVQWRIDTPAGAFEVRAVMDAQELGGRGSLAAVYWEGLSDLLDAGGAPVGRGYLEMTGYVEPLRLG